MLAQGRRADWLVEFGVLFVYYFAYGASCAPQRRAVRARRHLASAAGVQVGLDSEVGGPDTARDAINKTRVCAVDH